MNSYKYKPSTLMFEERIKHELVKLQNEYNNGKIKTKTQYALDIKKTVIDFYNKLGKPTFEAIEASDVPSFVHYKEMITNASNDMSELISGCENLNSTLFNMNIEMNEQTENVNKSISIIDLKIQEIENKIKSISDSSSMIFTDAFEFNNSQDSYSDSYKQTDVENNVCSLQTTTTNADNDFEINILSSSNGFPGNTHEVFEGINGIKYVAETEPRISIASVKTKDLKDWFEFEMYNLDDEIKLKTSSIGFKYEEGISWITNDEELKLDLKITFKTPRVLNVLKLNGIPKTNYHTEHPIISEIIIKDDYAGVQTIKYGGYLTENTFISFKPQVVKEVIIKISQKDSIINKVARTYALSIDTTKIPYFFNDDFKEFTQVDVPSISIESLGLLYNSKDKSIIYPSTDSLNSFMNKEFVKSNLFFSTINTKNNSKIFTDIVDAHRYRIGLSYISFEYREYVSNGIYISKNFEVQNKIKKVTLNAYDYIPDSFIKEQKINPEKYKNEFIKYFISFDNEDIWTQVYPRSSNQLGPCSIMINSFLNVESRNKNITYVDRLNDPTSVKIKIEIYRPENIQDETPAINEYNLDIDGDEFI